MNGHGTPKAPRQQSGGKSLQCKCANPYSARPGVPSFGQVNCDEKNCDQDRCGRSPPTCRESLEENPSEEHFLLNRGDDDRQEAQYGKRQTSLRCHPGQGPYRCSPVSFAPEDREGDIGSGDTRTHDAPRQKRTPPRTPVT